MKVYVIQHGYYSDRHITGVTTDEEKAKKICEMLDSSYSEWDTDQFEVPNAIRFEVMPPLYGEKNWYVEYDEYGIYSDYKENTEDYKDHFIIYADSSDQAVKIAQDMRAERLAVQKGIY